MSSIQKKYANPWKLSVEEKNWFNPDEKAEKIAEKTTQRKAEFENNLVKFLWKDPEINKLEDSITAIEWNIKKIQDDKDLFQDAKDKLIEKRKETLKQLLQEKKNMQLSPEQMEQIKDYLQKKVDQIDGMLNVEIPVYNINAEDMKQSIEQYEKEIKDIEEKISHETEDDIKDAYTQTLTKKQKALDNARWFKEWWEKLQKTGTIHGISSKNLEKARSDMKREMRKHWRDCYSIQWGQFVDTKDNNRKIDNLKEFDTSFKKHEKYHIFFDNPNFAAIRFDDENDKNDSYIMDLNTMKLIGSHDYTHTTIWSKKLYKVRSGVVEFLLDINTGERFTNILKECIKGDELQVVEFDTVSLVTWHDKDGHLNVYDYTNWLKKIGVYPLNSNLIKISDLQDNDTFKNKPSQRKNTLISDHNSVGEIDIEELEWYTLIEWQREDYSTHMNETLFWLVKDEDFAHPVYFVQGSMWNGKTILRTSAGDILVMWATQRNDYYWVFNIKDGTWLISPKEAKINTSKKYFKELSDNHVNIVNDKFETIVINKNNGKVEKILWKLYDWILNEKQNYSLLITNDALRKITDPMVQKLDYALRKISNSNKPQEPMVKKLEYTLGKKSVEILDIDWRDVSYDTLKRITSCVVMPARCDNRNWYILIDKNTWELLYKTLFDYFEEKTLWQFTFTKEGIFSGSKRTVQ